MPDSLQFPSVVLEKVALLFMATAYAVRLLWVHFRFKKSSERQPKTGNPRTTSVKGAVYSLFVIALPRDVESFRMRPFRYLQFVGFHLGIAAAVSLSFIISAGSLLLLHWGVLWTMRVLLASGAIFGATKTVLRLTLPAVRAVSSPDDYFSLVACTVWLVFGFLMLSMRGAAQAIFLNLYFYTLVLLNFYAPFSKLSHYIFYPFTRWGFGASMGHRGVYPWVRSKRPTPAADLKRLLP